MVEIECNRDDIFILTVCFYSLPQQTLIFWENFKGVIRTPQKFEILFLSIFSDAASFFRSAKIFRKNFIQKIFQYRIFPKGKKPQYWGKHSFSQLLWFFAFVKNSRLKNFLEKYFLENLRRPKKRCCVRKKHQKQVFEHLWGPYDPLKVLGETDCHAKKIGQ